jgi:4'-phosphopantetheinyl transferase
MAPHDPPASLGPDEVHLWFAFPDGAQLQDPQLLEAYRDLMSAEEREQQQRYLFPRHRHQALVARALVRVTLSRYCPEVAPADWTFVRNAHGRPEVAGPPGVPDLRFNLSHTAGLMVCAVTLARDVGVDVEDGQRRLADLSLAERFFSPAEVQDLRQLEPQRRRERFFALWTLKEAYIKARGEGLATPLRHFSFFLEGDRVEIRFARSLADEPGAWRFALMRPTPRHSSALAVRVVGGGRLVARVGQVVPLRAERAFPCATLATSSLGRRPAIDSGARWP